LFQKICHPYIGINGTSEVISKNSARLCSACAFHVIAFAILDVSVRKQVSEFMMTSEMLSNRARRLIYQASYTGMKETDLLLGHFAKAHLPGLNDDELDDFEALLDVGDPIIYAWVMGKEPVPLQYDTRVFQLIKKFKKA
jgi:succinate dehydrogenase flavin-adding protein (antitoxin of CptAB toxin-antitoxin module)